MGTEIDRRIMFAVIAVTFFYYMRLPLHRSIVGIIIVGIIVGSCRIHVRYTVPDVGNALNNYFSLT